MGVMHRRQTEIRAACAYRARSRLAATRNADYTLEAHRAQATKDSAAHTDG
jgi:hypothetical protein